MLPVASKLAAAMTGLGTLTAAFGLTALPGARGVLVATGASFALAGLLYLDRPAPEASSAAARRA